MTKHSPIRPKKPLFDDAREAGGPSPQHLVITGNGRIGGSSTADELTGGAGADILIGHGGTDLLVGMGGDDVLMAERTVARNPLLAGVSDYAIIYNGLQGADYTQAGLKASDHDLLIVHPASLIVNHAETLWSDTAVADIGTSKLVIAYLDITKVNDYETHVWQAGWTSNGLATGTDTGSAPSWLGGLDPGDATQSTRLIDLDDPDWVAGLRPLLYARIEALVARGYDGLFLDDLDRFFVPGNNAVTADRARDIRDLVIDLAEHARAEVIANGGSAQDAANFAIIVNGAPYLIGDTSADLSPPDVVQNELYYASIDGILAESYFAGNDNLAINQTITAFGARGIALFAADQNVAAGNVAAIEAAADLAGFIPYAITGDNYGYDGPRFVSTMGDDAPGHDNLGGEDGNDVLIGGAGHNGLVGNDGDDVIYAHDGDDLVSGGDGVDRIYGGGGVDVLSGEDGNDTIAGGDGNDLIGGSLGDDRLSGDGGADTIRGSFGHDQIFGGDGDDRLFGEYDDDLLEGGDGNDELKGEDGADDLAGDQGNDLLEGGLGADALAGGDGADRLYGGEGVDQHAGGAGDDLYYLDNAGDQVTEAAGEGFDRIFTGVSYVLAAGVHVEVLGTDLSYGVAPLNLTGNELVNVIYGNDGANVVDGRGGADTLSGLGGNDFYHVDNVGDRVVEAASGGTDRVFAALSYTLSAATHVEALSTSNNGGTQAINLTGNELAQAIYGNAGANSLNGGGGADMLAGFGGNDFYYVDDAGDQVVEGAAEGAADRIFAGLSYAIGAGAQVEMLTTTNHAGTTAIDLTGNALAQAIYGNAGANVLDGGGGADTLVGFGGVDQFRFATALGGGNVDRIVDFVSGSETILLDDAVFTGLAPGALPAGAFVTGTAAADANDRIVYDGATGRLYYDADGNGAGAALLFATLDGSPALAAGDFTVI